MGAALPIVLAVVGAASAMGSGIMQAKAAHDAAEAESDAADYNRRLELQRGSHEMERRHREGRRLIGKQIAVLGASGVLLEGSPLHFIAQNAAEIDADAHQAMWEAQGSAELFRKRGEAARDRGRSASQAALLGGIAGAGRSLLASGVGGGGAKGGAGAGGAGGGGGQ